MTGNFFCHRYRMTSGASQGCLNPAGPMTGCPSRGLARAHPTETEAVANPPSSEAESSGKTAWFRGTIDLTPQQKGTQRYEEILSRVFFGYIPGWLGKHGTGLVGGIGKRL